jgi:predicted dinucleotide-binding enzyme
MRIGVLGTGMVGKAIGTKLVQLGHQVRMGSRSAGNEKAVAWAAEAGPLASEGTFSGAAGFGEQVVFSCLSGAAAVDVLSGVAGELEGKLLIDVTNPLEFPADGPPTLFVGIDDSLGERIQHALPGARVVKALNTITCDVMVDPALLPGEHVIFICGDDAGAKAETRQLMGELGWPPERVLDIGDISSSRATEAYLLLWLRMMGSLGTARFNVAITRGG